MKTNKLIAGILLIAGLFTANAQIQTANVTSFGLQAGTLGTGTTYNGYLSGNTAISSTLYNTYLGYQAVKSNSAGNYNTAVGANTGLGILSGSENVYMGYLAGGAASNTTSNNNTYLGFKAGYFNTGGSNNVFIGHTAGSSTVYSNTLMIDVISTTSPLIWGDFNTNQLKFNGSVGIGEAQFFPATAGGVDVSNYKLFVRGGILANEVRVATTWADYVFEDMYALPSLNEVECFIDENGHLPNMPSAKQIEEDGISVGEMAKMQQEKIEELTLYIIEQDKQLKEQQETAQKQEDKLARQEKELAELKALVQGLVAKTK